MNPFASLPTLMNHFSRWPGDLEGLMGSLASAPREWWMRTFPYPLVNVREETDAFLVEAEVPGLRQDQIEVFVRNGTELTLKGERPSANSDGTGWLHRERGVGSFQRVLTLPVSVQPDKVEARLEHGVLFVRLPKVESVQSHRIPVRTASNGAAE